jgi:hypothetical protein
MLSVPLINTKNKAMLGARACLRALDLLLAGKELSLTLFLYILFLLFLWFYFLTLWKKNYQIHMLFSLTWFLNVITNFYLNFNNFFQLLCIVYENNNTNNKLFLKILFKSFIYS